MMGALMEAVRAPFETPAPDGWLDSGLLWFGDSLGQRTLLARGASLDLPDLSTAGPAACSDYYEALGTFLSQLSAEEAVQFQWRVDSDYHAELSNYRASGEVAGARGWCAHVRAERFRRYQARQAAGQLRRERLDVYLSRRSSGAPRRGFRHAGQVNAYMAQCAKSLGERLRQLEGRLPGGRVRVMDDAAHFRAWKAFCQPAWRRNSLAGDPDFDPSLSLLDNCWPGGGVASSDGEGGVCFRMDGHYHSMLVLRRWPMETSFGIIRALTTALAGNYCITFSCRPLDSAREVVRTEEEMRRLRGSRANEQKDSLDEVLRRKKAKITALQGGFARPFAVLPVIRVWDATLPGLLAQLQAVKEAVGSMGGAQCYQVDNPVQAKCLFYETMPGWLGGRYREWDLYALAGSDSSVCFLQDMLPLSSSHTGHLGDGEAIYDGEAGNLVGVRSFANGTPQHAVMVGTTRVGKSSQMIDYLSQSDCFFAFRGIIEEGLSYGTLVRLLGGTSLILHPDGDLCLNYLDTQGQPLTRAHVAAGAGLLQVMAGAAGDAEAARQRKALLSEYLEQLYADTWADFRSRHPGRELEAARRAIVLERLRREVAGTSQALTLGELHAVLTERAKRDPGEWAEGLAAIPEGEAVAFARRPATEGLVRDMGLAMLTPEQFPTHTSLVELLKYNRMPHHTREAVDRLASQLAPWLREGPNGRLFDGTSNCRLEGRLVHFELGLLPSSNAEMKEAAVYLVANQLRQRIISLPRALRKQFIFEEPSRYLKVGGMEELFAEFYAQMGKFGCQVIPVTQQYGQLARSALRPVIFGNSKQYFLFRQNDRHDLDEIGETIGLPESARGAIRRFSAPEYQARGEQYSQMAVFSVEGEGTGCGIVRNIVSPEMLYVADSSGACHDARRSALAKYADPLQGVLAETGAGKRPSQAVPAVSGI